ncbi:MAG: F0F1 ATP synthase subunit gamma [Lautropia sp.]
MSAHLADLSTRIAGVRQLGAVVNAMRGIASGRARRAREQLRAVDVHEATVVSAIGASLSATPAPTAPGPAAPAPPQRPGATRSAVVAFCAEQGFAGAFSERVLDALRPRPGDGASRLLIVGSRGVELAAARGLAVHWSSPMPSHSNGIVRLADRVADALYRLLGSDDPERIDVAFTVLPAGAAPVVERQHLYPLDLDALERRTASLRREGAGGAPLTTLAPSRLLAALTEDYVFARLCHAALHAFAAENEARMQTMAAAHRQIERRLAALEARQRRVRQDAITEEIVELAAGEAASRQRRDDAPRAGRSRGAAPEPATIAGCKPSLS